MEELKRVGGTSDATSTNKNVLVFAINGKRYEVSCDSTHPSTTLLEFLRSHTPFKSVKLSCGEGLSILLATIFHYLGFFAVKFCPFGPENLFFAYLLLIVTFIPSFDWFL